MSDMDAWQIVVLVFGLIFAGGFAFGGIMSYGSMTGQTNSQNQDRERIRLPNSNYQESSLNLSLRGRQALAARNDVVFVTVLYRNKSQKQNLEGIENITENFNDRIYLNKVNESESTAFTRYAFTEFPKAVALGAKGSSIVENPSETTVSNAACGQLRNWGSLASYCTR